MIPLPPEPAGVVISSKEIYEAVNRLSQNVAGLSGKVDVLIEQHSNTAIDVADHESRLRTAERRLWQLPSVASVLAVAALGWAIISSFM